MVSIHYHVIKMLVKTTAYFSSFNIFHSILRCENTTVKHNFVIVDGLGGKCL